MSVCFIGLSLFRRNCDSECSDGEEDFYYTEIKLNTDSVSDGLSSLSPVSPSVLSPPPGLDQRQPDGTNGAKSETSTTTPLSRSAPSALYLVHTDHAYQVQPNQSPWAMHIYITLHHFRDSLWCIQNTTTRQIQYGYDLVFLCNFRKQAEHLISESPLDMKTDSTGQAVHKDVLQSQYKAWKGHTWGELWLDYVPINGITYTTIQKFGVSRMFSLCLPKATFIESKYIRNSFLF